MVMTSEKTDPEALYRTAEGDFAHYEKVKDLIDECIDLALNYRQSGHPGGSRSKVHLLLALLFSGAMRWDVLHPWRPFGDRFVLSAGHTVPLIYARLAVLNEALRARHERDGDARFAFPDDGRWALTWEQLLKLRRRGGLPGHAEMEGKTLFLKFNTGPSGHGMPPAAGEAVALKLAGAEEVKVFVVEGEGGLTPGASHETRNTAWGLGLNNLVFLVDWNDYGIDDTPIHEVVPGTPESWFGAYDGRVTGALEGSEWAPVTRAVLEAARGENPERRPSIAWFKTRKGRGYGKYDNKSHGSPHAMNSPEFWAVRRAFMERHGVTYEGVDLPAPTDAAEQEAQARRNFERATSRPRPPPPPLHSPHPPPHPRRGGRHQRPADRGGDLRPLSGRGVQPRRPRVEDLRRPAHHRRDRLPAVDLEAARREGAQPRRAGRLGVVDQRLRQGRVRAAPGDRLLSRPGRLDQHRGLRQGFRRDARLGLVPARHEPTRRAAAPADHRVHQRGADGRPGHRQPGVGPDEVVQRVLGRLLDLRLVLVPQIQTHSPLLPP